MVTVAVNKKIVIRTWDCKPLPFIRSALDCAGWVSGSRVLGVCVPGLVSSTAWSAGMGPSLGCWVFSDPGNHLPTVCFYRFTCSGHFLSIESYST